MRFYTLILSVLFILLFVCESEAQNTYRYYFQNQEYKSCIEMADRAIEADTAAAIDHYFKGACALRLRELKTAEKHLEKAMEMQFKAKIFLYYNLAMLYAQKKKTVKSVAYLDSLLALPGLVYQPINDSLFDPIANEAEFVEKKDQLKAMVFPCKYDPKHTKLDFWLGDWDVYVRGVKRGENHISKENTGCILYEHYTTKGDFMGQSANFHDPEIDGWHQIWINHKGKITHYYEKEVAEGYLLLESPVKNQPRMRMSYQLEEDGSVRQLMYQYDPERDQWQKVFDGKYIQK